MKKRLLPLLAFTFCLNLVHAQMGGGGPKFDTAMTKLFGNNSSFSATMETDTTVNGTPMVMPGKFALLDGKSRLDMNLAEVTGAAIPPDAVARMKTMGMDKVTAITRPDLQVAYLVYPNLKAYAATPINDPGATNPAASYKIDTTEIGTETVDGHLCVKNDDVVTDDKGVKHESTVWNATDLKNFPIKVEMSTEGHTVTMLYKNVTLAKPDASLFDPPAGFTQYDSLQAMMEQEMMKRLRNSGPPTSGQ